MTTFGMFVKAAAPGRVKTRLAATIGDACAAELYRAFLCDLIERFRRTANRRVLAYAPSDDMTRECFQELSGGDFELWPQPDADLGIRMQSFFEAFGPEPVVLIGSDSPTLPAEFPAAALARLHDADVVLGPATDGGLYLIGLNQRRQAWPIFEGIDWSTSRVLQQVLLRLDQAQARVEVLPPWYDIDEPRDLDFLRGHLSALRFSNEKHSADAPATRSALELLSAMDVLADGR